VEAIMKMKIIMVLPVIFLLILTNCSLFEDPSSVTVIEPQEGDILVKGETFKIVTYIDVDYKISELNINLWLPTGFADSALADSVNKDTTRSEAYDSTLWVYHFSDEDEDFPRKLTIEKELKVPFNAPVDDDYRLVIDAFNMGKSFAQGYSLPVRVRPPED
jgi:hypothetical protein